MTAAPVFPSLVALSMVDVPAAPGDAHVPWIRPRYLWQDTDRHGNVRLYVARPGHPKIRIHAEAGSDAFWDGYRLALDGVALAKLPSMPVLEPAAEGSFRWLIERYQASGEFLGLDLSTRAARRNVLASCCLEPLAPGSPHLLDKIPIGKMTSSHIRGLRDRKREAPEAANNRIKVLRGLFKWALGNDDIVRRFPLAGNPARDVPGLRAPSDGFHTWTIEEVERFEAHHPEGSTARLALALLMFTGQRKSDIIRFGRQHLRQEFNPETRRAETWLHFTQHKNRNRKAVTLALPVLPVLEAAIAASPTRHLTFVINEYGNPFSEGGFGNRMRKWCDDAGLPECTAHGLRKAGACIAAENGATDAQMNAVFGWSGPKMAALYTRKARQKKIAGAAMHLIAAKRPAKAPALPLLDRAQELPAEPANPPTVPAVAKR